MRLGDFFEVNPVLRTAMLAFIISAALFLLHDFRGPRRIQQLRKSARRCAGCCGNDIQVQRQVGHGGLYLVSASWMLFSGFLPRVPAFFAHQAARGASFSICRVTFSAFFRLVIS